MSRFNKNLEILKVAKEQLGVTEWKEGSNPIIEKYHRHASKRDNNKQTDDVPWCSSAMCYIVEKVGLESTNSMRARSWEHWGYPVELDRAVPGDQAVFYRGSPWSGKGHVAIYIRHTDDAVLVAGGNQSDKYCLAWYDLDRLVAIRRHDYGAIPEVHKIREFAIREMPDVLWPKHRKLSFNEKVMDKTYRLFNGRVK